MNPFLKKFWNIISTVIVALIVLCAIFLMGSRLLGYRVFTVISGSMEPKYSVGDLIYVKQVDPDGIKKGDIITQSMQRRRVAPTVLQSIIHIFNRLFTRFSRSAVIKINNRFQRLTLSQTIIHYIL